MLIEAIWNRTIVMSGQFLLGAEHLEMTIDMFADVLQECLGDWNANRQIVPHPIKIRAQQYTFTGLETPYGIPDQIIKVVPTETLGVLNSQLLGSFYNRNGHGQGYNQYNEYLQEKETFPILWRSPVLTLPIHVPCEVHVSYDYKLEETPKADDPRDCTYQIRGLRQKDVTFFELARARFMISLGTQRDSFDMQDLPINLNGQDLVQRGEALEERALQRMQTQSKQWYLAWGG